MANESEDQWLYGDSADTKDDFPESNSNSQPLEKEVSYNEQDKLYEQNEKPIEEVDDEPTGEQEKVDNNGDTVPEENFEKNNDDEINEEEINQNEDSTTNEIKENGTNDDENQEEGNVDSDSESDDDVHVVIGDIKSTPAQYNSLNIKRGGLLTATTGTQEKPRQQPGKFSIDEFETIGAINGIPAHEFNLDQLEDKPWRQPGADVTDYFNYGFNEETWRAYCERQKRMRSESGVGLILNAGGSSGSGNMLNSGSKGPQVSITNYNSKYSDIVGPKRAGPPPGRKMAGTIDVIGSTSLASRRNLEKSPQKENVIQVMTADRRKYSRKPPGSGFPDMSVPPPGPAIPASFDMPPPGYQEPSDPYFISEPDPYYHSYEPTQDRQWGGDPTWQSTNVNIPLTGDDAKDGSKSIPTMVPSSMPPIVRDIRDRDRNRDRDRIRRDRDREYSEAMVRDRERERDRDRERNRGDKDSRRDEREVESSTREDDCDRDRSRSQHKHKDSRHRHRSRSKTRRHKSRSKSPNRRKKKSRKSDRERSKEGSE